MNTDLIQWWLNYLPLTKEENDLIRLKRVEYKLYNGNYKELEKEFFKNLLNSHISEQTHNITVSESATNLIEQLFKNEVDDDTLIISSNIEHEAVRNILSRYKNVLLLNYLESFNLKEKELFSIINNNIKNYKKVFIYIIGTHISTGLITPQTLFYNIKNILDSMNIPHKIVIDDVHGLFVTPRDYSIFDYIIGTAHALIRPYDMGLLISKDIKYGEKIYNWLNDYMIRLRIILKRLNKMRLFSYILSQELSDILSYKNISRYYDNTPNIFAIQFSNFRFNQKMYDDLDKYEIRVEKNIEGNDIVIIRLRAAQFITFPELLIDGIELLKKYIEEYQSISTMSLL